MAHELGSKRHRANLELAPKASCTAQEAIAALKKFKGVKFNQTVNVVMHLGIDTKQADQALRGSISLPNGIGKSKRVVAFCQSDVVAKALAAGAVKAGGEELVQEIEKGWMDFDVAVASPDMMRLISKLGKVLGPKGLMPSPKAGTVTPNVADAVKEYSAGKVEYRADTGGNVHAVIGKIGFAEKDLVENLEFFVKAIEKIKPSTAKGVYIKKITVSGAMTPGVQIKHEAAEAAE
jgi:large subunit ribosomal protein L1